MNPIIALVSNDASERVALKIFMQRQGYQVVDMPMQAGLLSSPLCDSAALVIIDVPHVRSPQERELILSWVREWRHVPIMALISTMDIHHAVPLLNAGVDNTLVKPFRRDELLAKVRALLRRVPPNSSSPRPMNVIDVQGVRIDLGARRAFVDNRDIHLTRKEFLLVAELATHLDAVCTHEELLAKVWGGEYWDANHYLHVYFGRIRKKMGARYGALIETISGMGYMLHSGKQQPYPVQAAVPVGSTA
ncbi:MAG: response regulator transcription factor [Anaerolineae bacterium]